jgi:hypothetical protein
MVVVEDTTTAKDNRNLLNNNLFKQLFLPPDYGNY